MPYRNVRTVYCALCHNVLQIWHCDSQCKSGRPPIREPLLASELGGPKQNGMGAGVTPGVDALSPIQELTFLWAYAERRFMVAPHAVVLLSGKVRGAKDESQKGEKQQRGTNSSSAHPCKSTPAAAGGAEGREAAKAQKGRPDASANEATGPFTSPAGAHLAMGQRRNVKEHCARAIVLFYPPGPSKKKAGGPRPAGSCRKRARTYASSAMSSARQHPNCWKRLCMGTPFGQTRMTAHRIAAGRQATRVSELRDRTVRRRGMPKTPRCATRPERRRRGGDPHMPSRPRQRPREHLQSGRLVATAPPARMAAARGRPPTQTSIRTMRAEDVLHPPHPEAKAWSPTMTSKTPARRPARAPTGPRQAGPGSAGAQGGRQQGNARNDRSPNARRRVPSRLECNRSGAHRGERTAGLCQAMFRAADVHPKRRFRLLLPNKGPTPYNAAQGRNPCKQKDNKFVERRHKLVEHNPSLWPSAFHTWSNRARILIAP